MGAWHPNPALEVALCRALRTAAPVLECLRLTDVSPELPALLDAATALPPGVRRLVLCQSTAASAGAGTLTAATARLAQSHPRCAVIIVSGKRKAR